MLNPFLMPEELLIPGAPQRCLIYEKPKQETGKVELSLPKGNLFGSDILTTTQMIRMPVRVSLLFYQIFLVLSECYLGFREVAVV